MKKKYSKIKLLTGVFLISIAFFGFTTPLSHSAKSISVETEPQDTFPVPHGIRNQLFYLQRTHNINTIICALNSTADGQLDPENPVHVFWIRYTEHSQAAELSFIQRVFAYGIKAKPLSADKFELHFVSYKKYHMYLMKSAIDHNYHVYAHIGQKQAIVNRIFIKINGGTFWSPNVEYIEVKGTDPDSGRELTERMKV